MDTIGPLEKRPLNLTARAGFLYKAAADTAPQIRLADDESEIVISGGYVDSVSRAAVKYLGDLDADSSYDWFLNLRNFFKGVDSFFLNRESYVTGEPLFEVKWRTLIGNSSGEITILTVLEEYGLQYRDCRQMIERLKTERPFPSLLTDTSSYFKRLLPIITSWYDAS